MARPASPNRRPQPSRLLTLPGEIRNQIYELLVVFPYPLSISRRKRYGSGPDHEPLPSLASLVVPLFLACRQLHVEASAVFYSQNHFAPPPNASQAPHQIQANLLFRGFLGPIGARNAALLRHLTIPFLADPTDLVQPRSSSHRHPFDVLEDAASSSSTIPALVAARCPNLQTIDLDLRCNDRWLRLLWPHTATVRALLAPLDAALRERLPVLRRVRLAGRKTPSGSDRMGDMMADRWEPLPDTMWAWMRAALDHEGLGWEVQLAEELEEREGEGEGEGEGGHATAGSAGEGDDDGWTNTWDWGQRSPRHAIWVLYGPPHMVMQSEIHDQWTMMDVIRFHLHYAGAWLKSPRKAAQDRGDAVEWKEWRRAMIARAGPIRVPLYCTSPSSSGMSMSTSMPRRNRATRRWLDLF